MSRSAFQALAIAYEYVYSSPDGIINVPTVLTSTAWLPSTCLFPPFRDREAPQLSAKLINLIKEKYF